MRLRPFLWIGLCLLVPAGLWFFWPSLHRDLAQKNKPPQLAAAAPNSTSTHSASTAPVLFAAKTATNTVARTNQFAWRLSNTPKTIGQLMNDPHAILLENAFIDTDAKLNLAIPKQLQSSGDPGAYIVQANGPIDGAFRAVLAAAGAQIVSYIPNNAYLVRISSGGAAGLASQPPVHSVIPYDPPYKVSAALIGPATEQKPLPTGAVLTLGLFADNAPATIDQIKNLGGAVVGTDHSPFGPVLRVIPPQNWTALAGLPGVQIIELAHRRAPANDLSRVTLGISTDTVTNANYRGLSGMNVLVEVNDTGIDSAHPDFSATGTAQGGPAGSTRVTGLPSSLVDVSGHGTHVAGILAGNGAASLGKAPLSSLNVGSVAQGSVTNADFRGKAPLANLYSFLALDSVGNLNISDEVLQEVPATNNALISNNSWDYDDSTYNLAAASYDAAVRDALPLVTGSQQVLFVFAAGNNGGGDDSGFGGFSDSILSPGTAKDVITVGALEQLRDITNIVTDANGNSNAVWEAATDSGNEVAGYSSRGNVGIGTEGAFGRFKPDVVAPGSFVVSTRSAQWDTNAYYNPTNVTFNGFFQQVVQPHTLNYYPVTVPANAVAITILIVPNDSSSFPFPTNLPIYVAESGFPTTTVNNGVTFKNEFDIPPDATAGFLQAVQNGGFNFAVGNTNGSRVNYDVIVEITTTNDLGNYFQVLDGLNETLAPYYRYESGTSMATPAVSGTLALMQDYFTNHTAQTLPSPALMKALLINGSRSQGSYEFAVTNDINLQGWGLPSLPAILPFGLTNQASAPCAAFFLDQGPTNALATGQSQTFNVNLETTDFNAQAQPLRVTLTWTDPPGNPAAAIKLVNSLELVVTNLDTGDFNFGSVYFGNDLDGGTNSEAWITNTTPNIDMVNNVQNVFLPAPLGAKYSVTVIGRSVNVNAVTAQTNNVVQDYALVISSGDGAVTNAITVTQSSPNPFVGPLVTFVGSTNTLLINQLAGGNTPLLGTNTVAAGAGYITNAAITVGMTNQWHFYVVANRLGFTNAAFITFLSQTLATPRMGVFADDTQNPTQPDADVDLYVAGPGDPLASSLTNLNPIVLSNCVHGVFGDGASLANGTGTEFVAYTNSHSTDVYYIGVKSETQVAAEYDFLPVFSLFPFSTTDANGNETVNGLLVPVNIPDGSPAHPGTAYVFALAVQPVQIQDVIVTNTFLSQNFGDLVGTFQHSGVSVVLNNHNSPPPTIPPDIFDFVYDDSPQPFIGSQPPDGPGSLKDFQGQQGIGPWILTEVDNSLTQTSSVTGLTLFLEPHISLTGGGADIALQPMSYFYGFIDVSAGATNLTIAATNITVIPDPTAPGQLFEKLNEQPAPPPASPTNFDKMVILDNPGPFGPGGVITVGPSDLPPIQPGRYFVTLYNPSTFPQNYHVVANIALGQALPLDFGASGPTNLLDDAVMYSSVFVTNTLPIATIGVGLRVDHPRISDLVFHLISPDGTRFLLMENRGADSTNGAGLTIVNTNDFPPVSFSGGPDPVTNIIDVSLTSGTVAIDYNFFSLPDEMSVLYQGVKIFDSGPINGSGTFQIPYGPGTSSNLTIIMNEFTNPAPTTEWNYIIHSVQTNYYYLTLTDDTNLTTTPIKFAPPPFVPSGIVPTVVMQDGFDQSVGGTYAAPSFVPGNGWQVTAGDVDVLDAGNTLPEFLPDTPPNCLDLNGNNPGTIVTNFTTIPGRQYSLSFAYTKNPSPANPGYPFFVASAQISITGLAPFTLSTEPTFTNSYFSLNWLHTNYVFTATSATTMLQFKSLNLSGNAGMFLDTISVKELAEGLGNLNYLPEQSLDPLLGTSPFGLWQLEIQDDRVGATNHTVLDSWQLQFVFAQTNPVPANIGVGVTNFIPPGGLAWYEVDVPTNADFATNILTFATGPVNVWFSTNAPPTIVNPFDVEFLTSQTAGSVTLGTNGSPVNTTSAYMVPGGTYFIGLQNPGAATVQYGFHVDFHLILPNLTNPYAFTQPAQAVTGTSAQLNGMATPNGAAATSWFEWGTNTLYGNQTPPVNVGSGSNVVYMASTISGLVPNLPYHFRLVVSNAQTVVYGFDQILDEATVAVWGADFAGQANVPTGLSNVVAIAGAYNHSLAVKNNETAIGWGDNFFGQATVPGALNVNVLAVAGGQTYSLALQNGGNVVAWGANTFPGETNVPAGLNNVVMIASGDYSSLALKSDGSVVAWGANIFGLTNVPATLSNVVSIAGGSLHNLALKYDGTVVAWGDDTLGQTDVPTGLTNVVAIAAGSAHSLALINDGTVVAWGNDDDGQVDVPPGLNNVVAVAAGGFSSLALKNDGSVVAWGDNSAGQSSVPVGLSNVVAIAAGYLHSLALTPFFNPNPINPIVLDLTNGVPQTNNILPGGLIFYKISVPTNADFATNSLFALNPNQSLNLWFTTQTPPTITNVNDSLLLAAATNGSSILSISSAPTNIVPGAIYYLGVQNTNSFTVSYGIGVDFHLVTSTNTPPTNTVPIASIVYTNIGGMNGFLLTWFAPSNDLFQVQWSDGIPFTWNTFSNIISYNTNFPASPTSAQFNFFDDGTQTGGFGPTRFYRLILLGSGPSANTPPVLPPQATQIINPLNPLVVTNTAMDADLPPQTLTYFISSTVTGPNVPTINPSTGVITWTPDVSQAGTSNVITTIVTDNGVPPLSATNSFSVVVNPVPGISSITFSNGGFLLTWFAPTNDIFQVQVATSLALPTVWQTIATNVIYTGPVTPTNGLFSYFDDGSQVPFGGLRFYRLQLVGITPSANTPPVLPTQTTQIINPLNPLIVTNTATDSDTPAQIITYTLTSTVTGPNVPVINTSTGVITWTPDVSQAGTSNVITTIATDNGVPPLSATNSFSVVVNPIPGISSITFTGSGYLVTWFAPTNDIFQVQVATNLALPIVWQTIATNVIYTGPLTPTNGLFSYFDNGSQVPFGGLRFYRLQLVGITPPATMTVPISSILSTNGGFLLTWLAPTNDQFNVRWATNLAAPINWSLFPAVVTSTNGVFTFMDTNAPLLVKFYDLLLLP